MELITLVKITKKNLRLILGYTLIIIIVATIAGILKPGTRQLEIFYDIGSEGSQETSDFRYDNHYRFEDGRKIIASSVEWLKDEAFIDQILNQAKVDEENFIKVKAIQVSDTTMKVIWKNKDDENLEEISIVTEEALQQKIDTINYNEDIKFIIYSNDFIIKNGDLPLWVYPLVGGFVGLWSIYLYLILKRYYAYNKKRLKRKK